ncbi:LOW QUALITY PROTEIN: hypothetical protein PHMEG_0003741 [Phytophthora megakarya]|uniref:Uncharacterized protein n=1 Tax=Phytophthora megakarya TaxID=4795 RepID=A0A225WVN5_9STRA|nr:LOW QUALITY PROTEIN: hypothetical protein PHMEG_0003741 [Phytophthora megakarya]
MWANITGEVGRQYLTSTTFADIRTRLDKAFAYVAPIWCIDKDRSHLLALQKHIQTVDEHNEGSGVSIESSSRDQSTCDESDVDQTDM